jgi:hypothetical protein
MLPTLNFFKKLIQGACILFYFILDEDVEIKRVDNFFCGGSFSQKERVRY